MPDCARLYNAALEEWRTAYQQAGVSLTMYDQMKELARFGVGMVDAMLTARGGGLIVVDEDEVDETEVDDDLVRDMTEIMTSFCARLYGRRSARNRARRALEAAGD